MARARTLRRRAAQHEEHFASRYPLIKSHRARGDDGRLGACCRTLDKGAFEMHVVLLGRSDRTVTQLTHHEHQRMPRRQARQPPPCAEASAAACHESPRPAMPSHANRARSCGAVARDAFARSSVRVGAEDTRRSNRRRGCRPNASDPKRSERLDEPGTHLHRAKPFFLGDPRAD